MPDFVAGTTKSRVSPPDNVRHIAVTGIMVGDANAVTVVEMARCRQLISAGALHVDSLLLPERSLPRGPDFGDV